MADHLDIDSDSDMDIMNVVSKRMKSYKRRIVKLERERHGSASGAAVHLDRAVAAERENERLKAMITALEEKNKDNKDEIAHLTSLVDTKCKGKERNVPPATQKELEHAEEQLRSFRERVESLETSVKQQADALEKSNLNAQARERVDTVISKILESDQHSRFDWLGACLRLLPPPDHPPQQRRDTRVFSSIPKHSHIIKKMSCHPGGFMYACERIVWVHDHGYIYGPSHRYDAREMKWVRCTELSSLVGKTQDLVTYRTDGKSAQYCGTFRAFLMPDMPIKRQELLSDHHKSLMQKLVFDHEGAHPFKHIVTDIWQQGIFRIECIGLQCVGFDETLYQELVDWDNKHKARSAKAKSKPILIPVPGASGSSSNKRKAPDDHSNATTKKAKTGKSKGGKKGKKRNNHEGKKKQAKQS